MKDNITFEATIETIDHYPPDNDTLCLDLCDVCEGLYRELGKRFECGQKVRITIEGVK